MSKVLTSLPVGERVGIAFSGGSRHLGRGRLDAPSRRRPLHVQRRPRPVRRGRHGRPAGPGQAVRRRDLAPGRLPRGAGRGRPGGADVRRVPRPQRHQGLLQHHAAGPRGHRHAAGRRDARGRRLDLGRRLHLQGQRHRAVLPLRPAGQPQPADLQAVAGRRFRRRARRPQGDVGVAGGARPALPRLGGEGLLHRRQHLGRDPRGEAAGAPRRLAGDRRADHGRAVLGPGGRDRRRGRHPRPSSRAARWRSTASGSAARSTW